LQVRREPRGVARISRPGAHLEAAADKGGREM
jgi:hypothetical protein